MEQYQHIIQVLALTMGASWASGINLYATMAVLGFASMNGSFTLPPDLQILANPMVMVAASLMYFVEFIADKTPGVDTGWDTIHTFVRIPAGAMMAAGAVGEVGAPMELAAAILGGGMATVSHATKAGSRVVINSSPEPFTNWAASIGEDVAVIGGLYAALHHPLWFLAAMVLFLIFAAWLLPKIWGAIKRVFRWIGRLFGGGGDAPPAAVVSNRASPVAAMGQGDNLDRLAKLKALLDDGALSRGEYEREKSRLLKE
ncbi:conserved hypothetical protein [Magnetococcus marinus MC-1]|uniref:DUF4126 domain-containing protein n=1 Tax=Magnetococcus marinus (strain ATCC BAA-1437 / JCM 17883 / MC-1) TaxID=156889 RepID=A0L7H5_MAGMM|nr:DUF4126 family protein [Magnetococcus marinus]ABK43918.1 conserved hypothetical protein [Magnetococcus marinus MC-1]